MEDLAMIRIYFLEMKIVINTMCNLSSAKKSRSTKKTFLTTNRNEGYYLKEDL